MQLLVVLSVLGLLWLTSIVLLLVALARARHEQERTPGLLRAGAPADAPVPEAFDRGASGRTAWPRSSGAVRAS